MFGVEYQAPGCIGRDQCSFSQDRHPTVGDDDGEVHEDAETCDPDTTELPVEEYESEEWEVGDEDERYGQFVSVRRYETCGSEKHKADEEQPPHPDSDAREVSEASSAQGPDDEGDDDYEQNPLHAVTVVTLATSNTPRSKDFAIVYRSGRLEGSVIEYLVDDGVATVTINDPARRNPLSNDVIAQLKNAVIRAGDDDAVAVVVITGAGDRAFSAGGDLASGFVDSPLPGHAARGELADLFRAMTLLPKPVVGRVNGAALGGGFGVAAACDITIVVEDAKMGTPEIGLGLWPMMISAVLFPLVPRKTLMWMMMTGAVITGERAAELGIATMSVPAPDLDDAVNGIVTKLKRAPSGAMALGKRSFYATASMDPDTALDHLHIGLTAVSFTDDAAEGVSAFLERRDPNWTGR